MTENIIMNSVTITISKSINQNNEQSVVINFEDLKGIRSIISINGSFENGDLYSEFIKFIQGLIK